jgi:nucleoside-diphosphate-sugar epimerase
VVNITGSLEEVVIQLVICKFSHLKKVLINGNMGYIGPVLVQHLKHVFPGITIIGFDTGFFAGCLVQSNVFPESKVDIQYFGDVRKFPDTIFEGVDAVIQLAAVSNDPMGNQFEKPTKEINELSAVEIARLAKKNGVKNFVFASSCSVYGAGGEKAKTENDALNPQTAYAKSKINAEKGLSELANDSFLITCLRFATACGFSPRLRLDLVLNDFVANAIKTGKIEILSDGSPLRPLIHVKDMALAMEWASTRSAEDGGKYLIVNAGSNEFNYQIKELAQQVADTIGNVEVSINTNASPDTRSYKVNFDYYKSLAPLHYPKMSLIDSVKDLYDGIVGSPSITKDFRTSQFIRLSTLRDLLAKKLINEQLNWD